MGWWSNFKNRRFQKRLNRAADIYSRELEAGYANYSNVSDLDRAWLNDWAKLGNNRESLRKRFNSANVVNTLSSLNALPSLKDIINKNTTITRPDMSDWGESERNFGSWFYDTMPNVANSYYNLEDANSLGFGNQLLDHHALWMENPYSYIESTSPITISMMNVSKKYGTNGEHLRYDQFTPEMWNEIYEDYKKNLTPSLRLGGLLQFHKNGGNLTKKKAESLKYSGGPGDIDSTRGMKPNKKLSKMLPKKHRFGSKVQGADKITIIGQPDMFEFGKFID